MNHTTTTALDEPDDQNTLHIGAPKPGAEAAGSDAFSDPEAFGLEPPVVITAEMETEWDLTPVLKCQAFEVGAKTWGLRVKRRDRAALERFFTSNPAWTAAHIVNVFKRCSTLGPVGRGYDRSFFPKRASDLKFLLSNLKKVIADLGLTMACPALVVLQKTDLYPARKYKRTPSWGPSPSRQGK